MIWRGCPPARARRSVGRRTTPKGQPNACGRVRRAIHERHKETAMRDRLMAETKAALKAQNKPRLSALRLISAALQQADIAARASIADGDIPAVLQRMIKQRRESQAIYEKAGRTEQAAQEAGEI